MFLIFYFFGRGVITAEELNDQLKVMNPSPSFQTTTALEDSYADTTTAKVLTITASPTTSIPPLLTSSTDTPVYTSTTASPTTSTPLLTTSTKSPLYYSTTKKPDGVVLFFPHHSNHPQYEEYQRNPFYSLQTTPAPTTSKPSRVIRPKVMTKPTYKISKPQKDQPLASPPVPNHSAWDMLLRGDPMVILLIIASILR